MISPNNMITLENITKSYKMGKRDLVVLKGINLQVKKRASWWRSWAAFRFR